MAATDLRAIALPIAPADPDRPPGDDQREDWRRRRPTLPVDRCVHVGERQRVRCERPSQLVWMLDDLAIAGTCLEHASDPWLVRLFARLRARRVTIGAGGERHV